MNALKTHVVGVISDTHGLLRPTALDALRGSDAIIHAGDIGDPQIISELQQIAPVTAIRGNIDSEPWAQTLPETSFLEIGGKLIHILHDLKHLDVDPKAAGFAAIISGHSHKASIETRKGVLYFNPGSAGPRRFNLPISVGKLILREGRNASAETITLQL
jgi:putative phosphoesterase